MAWFLLVGSVLICRLQQQCRHAIGFHLLLDMDRLHSWLILLSNSIILQHNSCRQLNAFTIQQQHLYLGSAVSSVPILTFVSLSLCAFTSMPEGGTLRCTSYQDHNRLCSLSESVHRPDLVPFWRCRPLNPAT